MTHAELEKIKNDIYNLTVDAIYNKIGLAPATEQFRDAVVCALEEAAAHFCTPEFGTSPEEE